MRLGKILATAALITALGIVGYNYGCVRKDGERLAAKIANEPGIVWQSKTLNLKQKEDLVKQGLESLSLEGKVAILKEEISGLDEVGKYEVAGTTVEGLSEENKYRVISDVFYRMPEEKSLELMEDYIGSVGEESRKDFLIRGIGYCDAESKKAIVDEYGTNFLRDLTDKFYNKLKNTKIKISKNQVKSEVEFSEISPDAQTQQIPQTQIQGG